MLTALLLALLAPSPEAEALGQRLARTGTLATMLPLMATKETADLVKDMPGLSPAEQDVLRRIGRETATRQIDRIATAMGRAYAEALTLDELKALVAFNEGPTATRYRSVTPQVMAGTMKAVGPIDFKGETMAAFCKETGKGCAKR